MTWKAISFARSMRDTYSKRMRWLLTSLLGILVVMVLVGAGLALAKGILSSVSRSPIVFDSAVDVAFSTSILSE